MSKIGLIAQEVKLTEMGIKEKQAMKILCTCWSLAKSCSWRALSASLRAFKRLQQSYTE